MSAAFSELLLPEPLMRGLSKAGYETPTPVQAQVIPMAMDGVDLMVSAATGSGKTAAFLIPMMQRFLDVRARETGVRGLVLTPTRELARQVLDHFMRLGSYSRLTAAAITGGESKAHQIATLRRNPEILVATPGRLLELLEARQTDLDDLEILVLDEADRMLDMGFADDVLAIIGRSPEGRQSLLFSATLHHRGLSGITDRLLRAPEVLIINPVREQHPDITHQMLISDGIEHKQQQLAWLLEHEGYEKAVVFTNTREGAEALGATLQAQGQRVAVLHGELDQRERNRIMGLFHSGRVRALVATDLAARGLDVIGLQRVFNFDVPRNGDDYLHRSGRTGRAGEPGIAISLVSPPEWNRMESISRYLKLSVELRVIEGLKPKLKGPLKRKTASKAAAARRPGAAAKPAQPKPKDRLRDRKNIGKRRKPSGVKAADVGDAPLSKKPQPAPSPQGASKRDRSQ